MNKDAETFVFAVLALILVCVSLLVGGYHYSIEPLMVIGGFGLALLAPMLLLGALAMPSY